MSQDGDDWRFSMAAHKEAAARERPDVAGLVREIGRASAELIPVHVRGTLGRCRAIIETLAGERDSVITEFQRFRVDVLPRHVVRCTQELQDKLAEAERQLAVYKAGGKP